MKKNQKGFGGIAILIIILVVLLVGGVGWFVWQSKHKSKASDQTTTTYTPPTSTITPVTKDETADWYEYESPANNYKIKLADGWKLERYQKSEAIYTFSNTDLVLKTGTKATVTEVEGGKDGGTGFFLNFVTSSNDVNTTGEKQTSLKTNAGLEIQIYRDTVTVEPDAIGPPKGSVVFTYVVQQNDTKIVTAGYSFVPGATDYHETVEKVLKTLSIL